MDSYELLDPTITVTICLDDDNNRDESQTLNAFDIERPSAKKYLIKVDDEILIGQLPFVVQKVLQLRLNPPEIGSMRNWEYIASLLGMSLDEIAMIRTQPNPVERILKEFSNISLNTLLTLIADVNRVDVLISLRPHLRNIKDHLVQIAPINLPRIQQISLAHQRLPDKFILVTHHELQNQNQSMSSITDSAIGIEAPPLNKRFRHLMKNFQKWGQTAGITVLDIDKCINEGNISDSLVQHFNSATQIILVATEAYKSHICSNIPTINPKIEIKRHLHEMMQLEYNSNGRCNTRFRVIIFSAEDRVFLPIGWASNTFVYTFPDNHIEIVKKVFEESNK